MTESDPPSPSEIADAGPFPPVDGVLDRSLALVEYLRKHCPWDRKQTALSLIPHLVEETHETVEAIREGDHDGLRSELGDLLLNLAFQVVVAEEAGRFTRHDVVRRLEEKMIRRHPHLFGLGERESWEAIKAREAAEAREGIGARETAEAREGIEAREAAEAGEGEARADEAPVAGSGRLDGLAAGLDPLLRAHRIQERAAGVGFDWDEASGALEKVREELGEVEEAMRGLADADAEKEEGAEASGDTLGDALEEEMGDLLFAVVNLARLAGAHAVPALERANVKFRRRFRRLELLAEEAGVPLPGASLEELDELWERIKGEERRG